MESLELLKVLRLERGTQEATELHCTHFSSVKADWPSKVSFSRRRKERQSRIRGVNRAEEGWADKKESWRKEEEMEE